MSLYIAGDLFGVTEANHLLTSGYNRVSGMGEKEVRMIKSGSEFELKTSESSIIKYISDPGADLALYQNYGGL